MDKSKQTYHDNQSSMEENKSSGWVLLLLGGLGLVVTVLAFFGVIPLNIGNKYLFYGVLFSLCILFIVMGVVSFKNAKVFAVKASSDKQVRERLVQWSKENLKAEEIDAEIANALMEMFTGDDSVPADYLLNSAEDEVLYFNRTKVLVDKLNHQFMNLDQSFLEHLVDSQIYDMVFESDEINSDDDSHEDLGAEE